MAHRKPPERFQAGVTGKELKNNRLILCPDFIAQDKEAGIYSILHLKQGSVEKISNKLTF
tara:strand:+ start:435 stop:614 length:180 start_codon:yes stop_codon:yes gene_type:complete